MKKEPFEAAGICKDNLILLALVARDLSNNSTKSNITNFMRLLNLQMPRTKETPGNAEDMAASASGGAATAASASGGAGESQKEQIQSIAKRYDGVYYTEDTVKENVQEAVKGNFEVYQTVVIGHIFARMSGSTDLMGRVSRYLEFNKPKP